jgi:hypothetical protein
VTNPGPGLKLCSVVSLKESLRAWITCAKRVVTFDGRPMVRLGIRFRWVVPVLVLAGLSSACSSKVVIATWTCSQSSDSGSPVSTSSDAGDSFEWSTSFEDGFCDYRAGGGFCFGTGVSSYQIVTSPVHSGNYAAAFNVTADPALTGNQVRCVRQGVLPAAAYYGAWYYVPNLAKNNGAVWNLFHFAGGAAAGDTLHGLWDISFINNPATGDLRLVVYQFPMKNAAGGVHDLSSIPAVPIGSWFHIQMLLKRASDATGEVEVLQDGVSILHLTGIVTDDSQWGQWYVGNLAENLTPPESTLYVDDVTISGAL